MLSSFKQLARRWQSWGAIDRAVDRAVQKGSADQDGSSRFGEAAARELDSALREAGASERQEGSGRLRWEVLGAINSSTGSHRAPPSFNRMRPLLVGVAAVVVVGVSAAIWYASPGASATSDSVAEANPADIEGEPSRLDGLMDLINENRPETPIEQEANAVMTDVKAAFSFFRARMLSPIPLPSSGGDAADPLARPSGV